MKKNEARVWVSSLYGENTSDYKAVRMIGIACNTPNPSILLVCREAYNVASKSYKPTLACVNSAPETYFNFETDTLCLEWENFFARQGFFSDNNPNFLPQLQLDVWNGFWPEDAEDLRKIERLAIRIRSSSLVFDALDDGIFDEEDIAMILRVFQGVKELSLIHQPPGNPYGDEDDSNLTRMDAVDVDKSITLFKDFESSADHIYEVACGDSSSIDMPEGLYDYVAGPTIYEAKIDDLQQRDGCWLVPEINTEYLVPFKVKKDYEEAEMSCLAVYGEIVERIMQK